MNWYPNQISERGLVGLSHYKYSAIDKSFISYYILTPYWNYIITLFPLWIAPNLITFLGFLFVLICCLLNIYYSPDLQTEAPSFIYLCFATGLWIYSTFDNVDGKQARRTKSSSPLGELFDHAVDALNVTFGALLQCSGLLLGPTKWSFLVIGIGTTAFYFATWETFHTGTLYLGYINGPTEGLLIVISSLIMSAYYGPNLWLTPTLQILPTWFITSLPISMVSFLEDLNIAQSSIYGMLFLLLFMQLPESFVRCYLACQSKRISFALAFIKTIPFLLLSGCVVAWSLAPHSVIFPDLAVWMLVAWGIASGRMNASIILNHVTHVDYPNDFFIVTPFLFGAVLSWAPIVLDRPVLFTQTSEHGYIIGVTLFVLVEYLLWAFKVVEQLCKKLKIECFRIKTD